MRSGIAVIDDQAGENFPIMFLNCRFPQSTVFREFLTESFFIANKLPLFVII